MSLQDRNLLSVPVPGVSPKATVYFTDDRPCHYLMLHLAAPEDAPEEFFYACRGMLKVLQARAAIFLGKDPKAWSSGLFPEARTYREDGCRGYFTWEFWWNDGSAWDVQGLWNALNTGEGGTFEEVFQANLALWS